MSDSNLELSQYFVLGPELYNQSQYFVLGLKLYVYRYFSDLNFLSLYFNFQHDPWKWTQYLLKCLQYVYIPL